MKQNKKKRFLKYRIGVTAFFSALLIVGVLNAVWPKPTYSASEKRELAKAPKFSFSALFDGSFISGYEKYLSDTFIGREQLFTLASKIRSHYGIQKGGDIVIVGPGTGGAHGKAETSSGTSSKSDNPSSGNPASDADTSSQNPGSQQTSSVPPAERDGEGEVVNNMVVGDSTVFQMYQYYEGVNNRYAKNVSLFAEKYPNVNTYCMVVPINTAFYLPQKYVNSTSDERESIQKIYDAMSDRVHTVDAYSKLEQHTNEYIYFRTDHHWTQLGAYYAYTAFAEATGTQPFSLEGMRTVEYPNFLGSLYTLVKENAAAAERLAKHSDTVIGYIPDFEYELNYYPDTSITEPWYVLGKGTLVSENCTADNKYMCFIHGDQPLEVIRNKSNQNGKTLILFKESYGNAFTPLVCHDYETTLVVDFRYFTANLSELMGMYNVTDALFLDYILAPGTSQRVDEIQDMVSR